jgi:hypothetical protein
MRDWKLVAAGLDLGIPAGDIDKIAPVLDALQASFRPLVEAIPFETEPAVVFPLPPEEES